MSGFVFKQLIEASAPEVQVVHRSLLVSHVYVEGEEVYWRRSSSAENLEKRRQPVPGYVGLRRRGA